jgi:hypothetical protein
MHGHCTAGRLKYAASTLAPQASIVEAVENNLGVTLSG